MDSDEFMRLLLAEGWVQMTYSPRLLKAATGLAPVGSSPGTTSGTGQSGTGAGRTGHVWNETLVADQCRVIDVKTR